MCYYWTVVPADGGILVGSIILLNFLNNIDGVAIEDLSLKSSIWASWNGEINNDTIASDLMLAEIFDRAY